MDSILPFTKQVINQTNFQRLNFLYQSGEISPNLVTLPTSHCYLADSATTKIKINETSYRRRIKFCKKIYRSIWQIEGWILQRQYCSLDDVSSIRVKPYFTLSPIPSSKRNFYSYLYFAESLESKNRGGRFFYSRGGILIAKLTENST